MFHTVENTKARPNPVGIDCTDFRRFRCQHRRQSRFGLYRQSRQSENQRPRPELGHANIQASGGEQPRDAVFQSLLQRAYLTQGAKQMGIAVSQEQIKQIIVDDPSFHDANGKFSQALLTQYLNQRRMSEDQFVEEIRDQFLFQNLQNLVQNGTIVSDAQAAQLVNIAQAARTVRSVTFNPEAFAGQIKVDDAILQRYYDANKKDYIIPQAVKIELVALTTQALADKQTVSDAELRQAFDKLPPRREIAHILFPVAQDASAEERAAAKSGSRKSAGDGKSEAFRLPRIGQTIFQRPRLGVQRRQFGLYAERRWTGYGI